MIIILYFDEFSIGARTRMNGGINILPMGKYVHLFRFLGSFDEHVGCELIAFIFVDKGAC